MSFSEWALPNAKALVVKKQFFYMALGNIVGVVILVGKLRLNGRGVTARRSVQADAQKPISNQ